ncbi:MAG TPA: YkvA family protein [Allosphingosinicella sp.]
MSRRVPGAVKRLRIEAHAAWLAARDRRTPWPARAIGFFVAAYALSPIDLIPDFIPGLGLLDDALIVPAGLWVFVKMVPKGLLEEHRAAAAAAAERPVSRLGIAIVLLAWAAAALLLYALLA